ncbi:hypothetical protein ES703_58055 [subsurface metagenome]
MLDPEEKNYRELDRLALLCRVPIPRAFITLEVFNRDGKLLRRHKQRSHSWTRNAYNHLFSNMCAKNATGAIFGAGELSFKATGAQVYGNTLFGSAIETTTGSYEGSYGLLAAAGLATSGIMVGSGENAESFEDYVLQTQILEGAGAGQLNHAASEAHAISYAAFVLKDELVRYFNNNSGASIDVNEVGLVIYMAKSFQNSYGRILFSRDKLPSTVTIPDTGQLKVTYSIELTYPA